MIQHIQKFQQYLINELHCIYTAVGLLFQNISTSGNISYKLTRRSQVRACPNTHTCDLGLLRACAHDRKSWHTCSKHTKFISSTTSEWYLRPNELWCGATEIWTRHGPKTSKVTSQDATECSSIPGSSLHRRLVAHYNSVQAFELQSPRSRSFFVCNGGTPAAVFTPLHILEALCECVRTYNEHV